MSDYSIKKEFEKKFISDYGVNLDILQLVAENNKLKQQILDAEKVIMRLESFDFNESDRKQIASKYWEKYKKC